MHKNAYHLQICTENKSMSDSDRDAYKSYDSILGTSSRFKPSVICIAKDFIFIYNYYISIFNVAEP